MRGVVIAIIALISSLLWLIFLAASDFSLLAISVGLVPALYVIDRTG